MTYIDLAGWLGYIDVVYHGKYIRNMHDKSNTFTVEEVNADFRHYIPILRRRSRLFHRKIETLNVSWKYLLTLTTHL